MNKKSYITYYKDEEILKNYIDREDKNQMILEFDWKLIKDKFEFIKYFYLKIKAPLDFGKNWDAFWDTISDQEFWIKKPLFIIIKNKNLLFSNEKNNKSINILNTIFIDLLDFDWYFIFIERK